MNNWEFKVGLLKEFWNNRNRCLVPPNSEGMGIKKQKFLVFYNLFARELSQPYTLDDLTAFEQGPIYHDIYRAVKDQDIFLEQLKIKEQKYSKELIDITLKLIESESSESLSQITHALDLWIDNYDEDYRGNDNKIDEKDITDDDSSILNVLIEYYKNIDSNYDIFIIKGKKCAIEKENQNKILEILNNENEEVASLIKELLKIDTLAKIDYDSSLSETEIGGLIVDI